MTPIDTFSLDDDAHIYKSKVNCACSVLGSKYLFLCVLIKRGEWTSLSLKGVILARWRHKTLGDFDRLSCVSGLKLDTFFKTENDHVLLCANDSMQIQPSIFSSPPGAVPFIHSVSPIVTVLFDTEPVWEWVPIGRELVASFLFKRKLISHQVEINEF